MHSNGQSVAAKPKTRESWHSIALGSWLKIVSESPWCLVLNMNEGPDSVVKHSWVARLVWANTFPASPASTPARPIYSSFPRCRARSGSQPGNRSPCCKVETGSGLHIRGAPQCLPPPGLLSESSPYPLSALYHELISAWNSNHILIFVHSGVNGSKAHTAEDYSNANLSFFPCRAEIATPGERNKILRWASSDVGDRAYLSNITSVDGQAAFLRKPQRTDHITRRLSQQINIQESFTLWIIHRISV